MDQKLVGEDASLPGAVWRSGWVDMTKVDDVVRYWYIATESCSRVSCTRSGCQWAGVAQSKGLRSSSSFSREEERGEQSGNVRQKASELVFRCGSR